MRVPCAFRARVGAMATPHVAVERRQLEGVVKCQTHLFEKLVPLLERLGPLVDHPNLMGEHALDSIGNYIDESKFDECRARLVSGAGMQLEYKIRKFDVLQCEVADALPPAKRRQCVAVRGCNEVARRLDPDERGTAEIVATFPGGGTLAVRKQRVPERMVVVLTSVKKKKKVLDADLPPEDAPKLKALFDEAAKGERQALFVPRTTSRYVSLEKHSYWELPAWYTEAVATVAQDVFRLHVLVSSTSVRLSRALFLDRVTAHRLNSGAPDTHKTLVKGILHRTSGGCACTLHRSAAPAEKFQRLEVCMEFCGAPIIDGKCSRHWNTNGTLPQSGRFPGTCMHGLKVDFRCAHVHAAGVRGGLRLPLKTDDEKMDIAFAKSYVTDVAACASRLMTVAAEEDKDLQLDMDATLAGLADARLRRNHMGEHMMQHDKTAVRMLRDRSTINKQGRFAGRVPAVCQAILKTHKHLFRVKE